MKKKGSIVVITGSEKPKKKPKEIFIVTSMDSGRSADGKYHSCRTWGWFTDFKTAEKSVLENWGDIFEGILSYAVIERVSEGTVINIPTEEYWYKWEGPWLMTENGKIGGYKPAKKPKQYKNTICFWG